LRAKPIELPFDASLAEADTRFGVRAMLFLCAALIALTIFMMALTRVDEAHFSPIVASYMMLSLWSGLIVGGIAQIIALITPGRWRLEVRAPWLLIAILMTGMTLPLFELFKQVILPIRGFPLDPALAAADYFLFGGHDAWTVTHALFGSVGATLVFDRAYAIWLPLMFLFPAVAVMATGDVRLRVRLLGCWLSAWVLIGSIGAWLFGSAGPCYYNYLVGPHAGFADLHQHLAALGRSAQANGQVIAAIDFQTMLRSGHGSTEFVSAGGISAMPSMHVAMATLFALAGFKIVRPLGWILTLYALMIWVGSIHLGWHYAIDGIVGAAMTLGLWWLSGHAVANRTRPLAAPLSRMTETR
jgi:hypothetical protein